MRKIIIFLVLLLACSIRVGAQQQFPGAAAVGGITSSGGSVKVVTASDNFTRANTVGSLGTSSSGLSWTLTGAAAGTAGINGNIYTAGTLSSSQVVYASIISPTTPIRIAGTFSYVGGSGSCGGVTLVSSADATPTLNRMLHLTIDCNASTLTWWNGASQNNLPQVVVGSGTNSSTLLTNGTVYSVAMTFYGNWVEIEKPDGTTFWCYDTNFPAVEGSQAIYEIQDANTGFHPGWNSIEMDAATSSVINGQMQVNGGLQRTPIGSSQPAAGFFTGIGVGNTTPAALIHVTGNVSSIDLARFEGINATPVVRIRSSVASFGPTLAFEEAGQTATQIPKIYSNGSSSDLRLNVNNSDEIVIPFSGGINLNDSVRVSTITSGNCVQAGAAGLLTSTASPCGGGFTSVNVTPVTVSAAVTTDQNLMAVTIPAGTLNLLNKTLNVNVSGVYSTPAASTATVNLKVKLCTVSGCGTGTVLTLFSVTSSANPGSVTNNALNINNLYITTQTAGATASFEAHGVMGIDLGALTTSPDSFFNDTNTATIGTIDTTAQLFLQVTAAFSAASASNSVTERSLIVESAN